MSDSHSIHICALSGSIRRASVNSGLLRAAKKLLPDSTSLEIIPISELPFFNEDMISDGILPESVAVYRTALQRADALLFAVPEYNYSVTGLLKNAIDWASRNPDPPMFGKPAAIIGASSGPSGTLRAQIHLRQIFVYLNIHPLNKPELIVAGAKEKFDCAGNLTDDATAGKLKEVLSALREWTLTLKKYKY